MTEYFRGYPIEFNGLEYIFSDTKQSTADTWESRPCGHCGKFNTEDGHDACIANLPGVINACCGHGHDKAYVQFENEKTIRGRFDE